MQNTNLTHYIVTFENEYAVLAAEKKVKAKIGTRSVKVDFAPVPREISSECGMGLKITCNTDCDIDNLLSGIGHLQWHRLAQ